MENFLHFGMADVENINHPEISNFLKEENNFFPKIVLFTKKILIPYNGYLDHIHINKWLMSHIYNNVHDFTNPDDLEDILMRKKFSIVYKGEHKGKLWAWFKAASAEFSNIFFISTIGHEYISSNFEQFPETRIIFHKNRPQTNILFEGDSYYELKSFIIGEMFGDVTFLKPNIVLPIMKNSGLSMITLIAKNTEDLENLSPIFDKATQDLKDYIIRTKATIENFKNDLVLKRNYKNIKLPSVALLEYGIEGLMFHFLENDQEDNLDHDKILEFVKKFSEHRLHYHINSDEDKEKNPKSCQVNFIYNILDN